MKEHAPPKQEAFIRPAPGQYIFTDCFIDGSWAPATGNDTLAFQDSGTEDTIGSARSAGVSDIDAAVHAASGALPGWKARSAQERADTLHAVARELRGRSSELAAAIAAEVGTAVRMAAAIQVVSAIDILELTADLVVQERFEEEVGNSRVTYEPVGVVAAITPWNYPLFQTMSKFAAALASGCTVVHKPSELAPISSFILAEACMSAGLPSGTYNLVPGAGATVGETLATHPGVSMVTFTGSTAVGRRVYELAARSIKRVALELGGKSASLVLDDADLDLAVKTTVNRAFLNSGQTCDAWSRLLVPAQLISEVRDRAVFFSDRLTLGDPFDKSTKLGPLVSARQLERVQGYVDGAVAQGAHLEVGGSTRPDQFPRGYYFWPTVISGVTPSMTIASEEVFGPVLALMAYESEDQAVAWANATDYGLSGSVWSADPGRAKRVAAAMHAGQVVVNGGRYNPLAPFGGVKQSGIGRELGRYGLREYLETKAVQW